MTAGGRKACQRVTAVSGRTSPPISLTPLANDRYLHKFDVIHRDIKGQNVLIADGGVIKLCDFGVSTFLHRLRTKRATSIGTP